MNWPCPWPLSSANLACSIRALNGEAFWLAVPCSPAMGGEWTGSDWLSKWSWRSRQTASPWRKYSVEREGEAQSLELGLLMGERHSYGFSGSTSSIQDRVQMSSNKTSSRPAGWGSEPLEKHGVLSDWLQNWVGLDLPPTWTGRTLPF